MMKWDRKRCPTEQYAMYVEEKLADDHLSAEVRYRYMKDFAALDVQWEQKCMLDRIGAELGRIARVLERDEERRATHTQRERQ